MVEHLLAICETLGLSIKEKNPISTDGTYKDKDIKLEILAVSKLHITRLSSIEL